MYYPEDVVEEVRSRSDIVEVISPYVKLTRRGSNYFGCCPFHNEKTPSFSVSPGKQMYYCFGCGAGGNVFSFVMEYENYSFTEALKYLAGRAGIRLPEREAAPEQRKEESLKHRLLEMNGEAARYYYYQLRSSRGTLGIKYLTNRGLSDETMKKFGLGYSLPYPDDLYRYLKKKGYKDEELEQSGLVKIKETGVNDRFWNRVMFPIMDVQNRVIGFGGRVMGEGEPKYLNSPETKLFDKSRNLYGLNLARRSRRPYMLLCEGYMDVIALHQAGFDCAVASLGTALTTGHAVLLKRYTSDIIITYDSDGAGQKAAMRAIPILREAGFSVKVLNMKPYKDPDEFIVNLGAEAYEQRIQEAVNFFLFQSDVLRSQHDFSDPDKKTAFQRTLAEMLTEFPDALERENYLQSVAERHQIPAGPLREMMNRIGNQKVVREPAPAAEISDENGKVQRTAAKKDKEEGILEAQRLLLSWAAGKDISIEVIERNLQAEDFSDNVFREVFLCICAMKAAGRDTEPAAVISYFLEDDVKRGQVTEIFNAGFAEDTAEETKMHILSESLRRIRKKRLDQEIKQVNDPQRMQEIIMQIRGLNTLHILP